MRFRPGFTLIGLLLLSRAILPALELHRERAAATDLAVSGLLPGLASGETRYLRWADLARLPTTQLELDGEFMPGRQTVTVLFVDDLWRMLTPDGDADALLATCADGYFSVFPATVIARCRPFLVLRINGVGPDGWPPAGLKFDPGPYVISVSAQVAPAVGQLLDASHKKPWGVNTLQFVRFRAAFAGFYEGKWAALSAGAAAGRDLWINSCASCHEGPPGTAGGTKANRPFPVLAAQAGNHPDFFKGYVRHPQALVATARMEPHPHYTDAQLDALIAFILAEAAP